MRNLALAAALALAASTTTAAAYERTWRPHSSHGYGQGYGYGHGYRGDDIDRQQAQQRYRIEQGRRSGELTRREYWQLRAEQARIAALERRYRSDGHLSPQERSHLRSLLEQASRNIHRETHDSERRRPRYWW